jgi:tetratricopeptide (TPR) repeat protein
LETIVKRYINSYTCATIASLLIVCLAAASEAQPIGAESQARFQVKEAPIHLLSLAAQDLVSRGKLTEAVPLFERVIANPGVREWDRISLADIYTRIGKPDDVLRVLQPVLFPQYSLSSGKVPGVRMLYVLALLEKQRWQDAVDIYEPTINSNPKWQLRFIQPDHTFPNVHFDSRRPEYAALRAQAHFILGASQTIVYISESQQNAYMLGHMEQYLKYNSVSAEAHFVSGLLLTQLLRYDEAHREFALAKDMAPDDAQPEIAKGLKELTSREEQQKAYEASKAAAAKTSSSLPQ